MKFKCDKSALQNACQTCARASASKSPIAALEGLLLEVKNETVQITGYDLRKGIFTSVEAETEEPGKIVINARLLCEMIRRMPDGIVSITSDGNENISIKCGRSQFNIKGIDASDYPEIPEIEEKNTATIPQKVLKSMINQTIFAVSDNDARPIYTGTLFEIEENTLTLVSVDGYRLAKRTEKVEGDEMDSYRLAKRTEKVEGDEMDSCSFVVPGYSLTDIEKICSDDEKKKACISIGEKHISFRMEETVVVTRRLEGEFLNYRKSLPEKYAYIVEVDKSALISTIDRVSLIISEKNTSPVRMTFDDGKIECLCLTTIGKAEDVCFCEGTAEGMTIGFNDRYFMDALKAAGKEKLQLCLNTPSSPAILRAADGSDNFTYMILPVRLKAGD